MAGFILLVIFFALSFIISIVSLCLYFYYLLNKNKYTRERFAFSLALHYSGLISLFIEYLLAPNYLETVINFVITEFFHRQELHFEQPTIVEIIAAIIILITYFHFTQKLYRNWSGGKSEAEKENSYVSQEPYFPNDVLQFLINNRSNIISHEKNQDGKIQEFDSMVVESLAWHKQVASLLKLKDFQYHLDEEKDWYASHNCYITTYGNNEQKVAILCSQNIVSDAKLSDFIRFVKSLNKGGEDILYIWAIQDNVDFETKQLDGQHIKIVTEKKLLDTLVDFTDYKRYINNRFSKNEIYEGYKLTINDIYVEPNCSVYDIENKQYDEINSIENYVANWVNDNSQHKQLALLGDYGQGKSVLSLRLAYQILNGNIKSDRIPIIIELRGRYVKQYSDTREILSTWANKYDIKPKALLKLLYAGRLLLIFEGFDELDLIGGEEIRKEHFRKLWEYSIEKSKIIITGRPNYFLDDKEMTTLLRLFEKNPDNSKYCEIIHLEPFTRDQIFVAMRSVKEKVRNEIIDVYDREGVGSSFNDLVSRPSLLFLTGLIWEKEELATKLLNINSAEVIRAFLNFSYKRQDKKKDTTTIMNSDERAYFMKGIAVYIVSRNGFTNQIGKKELESVVGKLLNSFPDEITKRSVDANQTPLRNRLEPKELPSAVETDIRSCGVLVKDFSAADTFCFAHKSFLEVLIAEFLADSYIMKNKVNDHDLQYLINMSIINSLKINYNDDEFLRDRNIFGFVVDLLSAKIDLVGISDTKEKVLSIYKQLNLYPFSIRSLGFIHGTFGAVFLREKVYYIFFIFISMLPAFLIPLILKDYFIKNHIDPVLLIILVCLLVLFSIISINCLKLIYFIKKKGDQIILKGKKSNKILNHIVLRCLSFLDLSDLDETRLGDRRAIAFFLVCKKKKAEKALLHFWPSYVYAVFNLLAEKYENKNK